MYWKRDARGELLFWSLNLLFFKVVVVVVVSRSFLSWVLRQVTSGLGLVQLHLNKVNNIQIVETAGKPQQFLKIVRLFFILANMFRRYIRHRQCDGYESL